MEAELIPGIDRFEGIRDFEKLEDMNFGEWMQYLEINKEAKNLPENYSSHTLFLVIENDEIVGAIGLRWEEVPILIKYGGFIGYSIRPSKRGNGYGNEMLRLGLEEFRKKNRKKILITSKDFNIASKKVIENNGGIYENSFYNEDEGYTYLRYWINL